MKRTRGRPIGATTKPQIKDYISVEEMIKLVGVMIKKAKEGDAVMLKFLGEQIFGKAEQNLNLGNANGEAFKVIVEEYVKK